MDKFNFEPGERRNFTQIPNCTRKELDHYERDLYTHITYICYGPTSELQQSTRTIAEETGMSRNKIIEALQSLVDKGYIEKTRDGRPGFSDGGARTASYRLRNIWDRNDVVCGTSDRAKEKRHAIFTAVAEDSMHLIEDQLDGYDWATPMAKEAGYLDEEPPADSEQVFDDLEQAGDENEEISGLNSNQSGLNTNRRGLNTNQRGLNTNQPWFESQPEVIQDKSNISNTAVSESNSPANHPTESDRHSTPSGRGVEKKKRRTRRGRPTTTGNLSTMQSDPEEEQAPEGLELIIVERTKSKRLTPKQSEKLGDPVVISDPSNLKETKQLIATEMWDKDPDFREWVVSRLDWIATQVGGSKKLSRTKAISFLRNQMVSKDKFGWSKFKERGGVDANNPIDAHNKRLEKMWDDEEEWKPTLPPDVR